MKSSIIDNLPASVLITLVRVCFLVHCFTVVFIVINPVYLELEELLRIPKGEHKQDMSHSLMQPYTI